MQVYTVYSILLILFLIMKILTEVNIKFFLEKKIDYIKLIQNPHRYIAKKKNNNLSSIYLQKVQF